MPFLRERGELHAPKACISNVFNSLNVLGPPPRRFPLSACMWASLQVVKRVCLPRGPHAGLTKSCACGPSGRQRPGVSASDKPRRSTRTACASVGGLPDAPPSTSAQQLVGAKHKPLLRKAYRIGEAKRVPTPKPPKRPKAKKQKPRFTEAEFKRQRLAQEAARAAAQAKRDVARAYEVRQPCKASAHGVDCTAHCSAQCVPAPSCTYSERHSRWESEVA